MTCENIPPAFSGKDSRNIDGNVNRIDSKSSRLTTKRKKKMCDGPENV